VFGDGMGWDGMGCEIQFIEAQPHLVEFISRGSWRTSWLNTRINKNKKYINNFFLLFCFICISPKNLQFTSLHCTSKNINVYIYI
jgi:hypothetical protein